MRIKPGLGGSPGDPLRVRVSKKNNVQCGRVFSLHWYLIATEPGNILVRIRFEILELLRHLPGQVIGLEWTLVCVDVNSSG